MLLGLEAGNVPVSAGAVSRLCCIVRHLDECRQELPAVRDCCLEPDAHVTLHKERQHQRRTEESNVPHRNSIANDAFQQ